MVSLSPPQIYLGASTVSWRWLCTSHPPSTATIKCHRCILFQFATNFLWDLWQLPPLSGLNAKERVGAGLSEVRWPVNQPWPQGGVTSLGTKVSLDPSSILQVLWDELPILTPGLDTPCNQVWATDGRGSGELTLPRCPVY